MVLRTEALPRVEGHLTIRCGEGQRARSLAHKLGEPRPQ